MAQTLLDDSRRFGIEWRNPGPAPPKKTKWLPLLALLRERPGTWAMIQGYRSYRTAQGTANRLRVAHKDFEFEARPINRENLEGPGELFARKRS